jgi:cytochrome b
MIRVWDPFLRMFHWALALSFAIAWLSGEGSTTSPATRSPRW